MPRLSNEMINNRVRAAMQPPAQQVAGKLPPTTMENLIQKAKAKRGAAPEIKLSPEQKVDLKARGI